MPRLAIGLLLTATVLTAAATASAAPTKVTVYATGLFNPKGLTFDAGGTLYVAESGPPGDVMVPLPVNFGGEGPIGTRASVSKIPPGGGPAQKFVTGLPNIGLYGGVEMLGAASMTMFDGQLYELAAGHMTVSPTLSRVSSDGKLTVVADIGKFNDENPPPRVNADAIPKGNPFDVVALGDRMYISDGNFNSLIELKPATGKLRLVAEFLPGPVTVGMAAGPDRNIYVAQFSNAPYLRGSGYINRVTPAGKVTRAVTGLTTPIDVAFAPDGTMYVLQFAARFNATKLRYVERTGALFRIGRDGSKQPVVTGLMFPTALAFGPDGALYVSNFGNEANDGEGQVLRVEPGDTSVAAPRVPEPRVKGSYNIPSVTSTVDAGDLEGAAKLAIIEPVEVEKWGYRPSTLNVAAGQKIVVTNEGRIGHTATSTTGVFDTGNLLSKKSAVLEIATPGKYQLLCTPHPWMKATIVVAGTATSTEAAEESAPPVVDPPSLNVAAVAGTVGLIVLGVFGLAWLARRRPES